MCGVPYDQRIDVPPGLILRAVYLDERCGVRASTQEPGRLFGTPLVDGTHVLRLECADASGAAVMGEARLVISRDPRSLWRNVPSDRNGPHWKPDQASTRRECRGWLAQGLSRRGRSHANTGKFREDDLAVGVLQQHLLAVAVADGAGSAPLSRLGSRVAVEAALQLIAQRAAQYSDATLTDARLEAWLAAAAVASWGAIETAADQQGATLTDLSTTLLLGLLVTTDAPRFACLQIGDGVIACHDAAGIRPLADVDRGEYSSQTVFVSAARVQPKELATRIHVHTLRAPRWILLATDGVTDPYLETEQALHDAQCWAPLDTALSRAAGHADADAAERELAEWLDAFTPGHHDDRTLVLLHPTARGRPT